MSKQSNKNNSQKAKPKGQKPKNKNNNKKSRQQQGTKTLSGKGTGVSAAYAQGIKSNKPSINYSKNARECRVVHKEFVKNIAGTVAFATPLQFECNPGLPQSFPWLSAIANNFEQYRFNSLKVRYLTRCGTQTAGSVLIYPDYDAADAAPVSEQVASNYQEISEDAPWKDITCNLRVAAMHSMGPKKFVRSGSPAQNLDIKTYDVGKIFVSTVDGVDAAAWGKLWVEYDITFFEPQMLPGGAVSFIGGAIASANPGVGTTAINPLGTQSVLQPEANGFTRDIDTTISRLIFSQTGTVMVVLSANVTGCTALSCTPQFGATLIGEISIIDALATNVVYMGIFTVVPLSGLKFQGIATTVVQTVIRVASSPEGSQS